jgi:Holliday junction resolvasome RuvABC endonuclease subunit
MEGAILALDLGTHTGFALTAGNSLPHTLLGNVVVGTWHCKTAKETDGDRYHNFRKKLVEISGSSQFTHVYYERVRRHVGTDAAHVYGGLRGILIEFCEARKIPHEGVPVGTIKKSWTGRGNATKDLMIAEAEARGFEVENDNEADALALLHWAVSSRAPAKVQ